MRVEEGPDRIDHLRTETRDASLLSDGDRDVGISAFPILTPEGRVEVVCSGGYGKGVGCEEEEQKPERGAEGEHCDNLSLGEWEAAGQVTDPLDH